MNWRTGVDAAVNWGNGKLFLFKGDSYLRYDMTAALPAPHQVNASGEAVMPLQWVATSRVPCSKDPVSVL
ncbi:hemopexin repeat-containing protein [Streptomyces sp. NPDC056437]|uniref:hemopexin repeat-containing protein n=1 Tax=Streptomyces sp. NPDC056437 TaxID=3345816 RepID=UPI00369B872A